MLLTTEVIDIFAFNADYVYDIQYIFFTQNQNGHLRPPLFSMYDIRIDRSQQLNWPFHKANYGLIYNNFPGNIW